MNKKDGRIIIIGGGPAGISAAIQLKRVGLEPLILEQRALGGLLWNANLVENYPGFPNGISGEKLVGLMTQQVERLGVEVRQEQVRRADWLDDHFLVTTPQAAHIAETLVIASGTLSRPLPPIVSPEARTRVFTEVRELSGEQGRTIVIVGAGDAAFDYALNLSKKRNFVTILNRGENVKCLSLLYERVIKEPDIQYRACASVRQVRLDEGSGGLELQVETTQEGTLLMNADFLLFAIGRVPCRDFVSEAILQHERELLESGRLYWIGDVSNGSFRQAAIAAGDGLRAAMQIHQRSNP